MDKIGFSIKRRPRTNKLRMKEMEISAESKALVVYPGGGEDGTPLGSHPEGVTVNERDESANVPPGPVKASQLFKHLCKPAVYVDNVLKMGFTSAHVEIIKKTPFGALVDMQPFVVDGRLLADIVRCHQGGDVFIFCGKVVSFSAEDLALILGLPCRGMKIVDAGQKKEGRLYRRFGQHFDLHNKGLLRLITDLVSSKIQDDIEDTVRLWIAYMFAMFLAPKSNQSCPRYFIPYLDDLSLLGEMDWTSAIKELTVAGLAEVASCL